MELARFKPQTYPATTAPTKLPQADVLTRATLAKTKKEVQAPIKVRRTLTETYSSVAQIIGNLIIMKRGETTLCDSAFF